MSDDLRYPALGAKTQGSFGVGPVARGIERLRALVASPIAAIGFGLVVVAAGLLLRRSLDDPEPRLITLYPAVAIAALIGGPLSGLVATVVAAIFAIVFVFEPIGSFVVAGNGDFVSLANFTVTGALICLIAAVDRSVAARMRRATRDKAAADARLRSVFDALHEGVIVFGPAGNVLSCNPSAERILGYRAGDLTRDGGVPPDWWLLHPDGSRMTVDAHPLTRVLRDRVAVHDELLGYVRGPSTRWLLNNAVPLLDPTTGDVEVVIASFVDITERRKVERDLAESRAHLASVLHALHEGVVVFDGQGRALSCNRAAETILRRSAGDLTGVGGFLALGRTTIHGDGSPFPIDERPIRRTLRTGRPARDVVAGIVDDGGTIWLQVNVEAIRDPSTETVVAAVASFTDISDRRRQERELAESRAQLASIFAALHEAVVVFGQDGRILTWNPSAERVLRLASDDLRGFENAFVERQLLDEDGRALAMEDYPAVRTLRTGQACHGIILGAPVEDGHIWLLVNSEPIRDTATGEVRAAVVSLNDVTERRRVHRELEESRARFASIMSSAMDAIVTVDAEGRIVLFNAAAERMYGISEAEALGRTIDAFIPTGARDAHRAGFAGYVAGDGGARSMAQGRVLRALRSDGSAFPIEASISRVDVEGKPLFTVIHRDISARLEAERTDAELAAVVKSSPDAIVTSDLAGRILTVNDAGLRLFGYTADQVVGRNLSMFSVPGQPDRVEDVTARALAGQAVQVETVRRHADGRPVEVLISAGPIRDAAGRIVSLLAILSDIGTRKEKERQLAERDQELRQTLDAAGLGVWWIDVAAAEMYCDPRSRSLFGVCDATPLAGVADRLHGEDRADFLSIRETLAPPHTDRPLVVRVSGPEGATIWLSLTARLRRTNDGREEIWGTVQDVTEQRKAEQALKQLEASRRLEALGRMTGGIAHDFNNLLTIVSGNLQLLDLSPDDAEARRWLAEAMKATESGAALNKRLITFARQRRLDPTVCDLNDLVGSMLDLLRRSVGPDIVIATALDAALGATRVDPSEIENAVLNLVFNARDAMPSGGRILIETRNTVVDEAAAAADAGVRPGPHVLLAVTDTGTGMSAAVQARAFEPFFTTKEVGRGSGLGLATLHGFVHQSGGFVTLYSEVGYGTTVNIYLPRLDIDTGGPSPSPAAELVIGRGQTILLVEDNPDVAAVTRRRLTALGYRVRSAGDAAEALRALAEDDAVDLVFTDVIMPGRMSGIDLARHLRAADPTRRVLLTSGFAEEIVVESGAGDQAFAVLRKPYALVDLSLAIATALANDQPRFTSEVKT